MVFPFHATETVFAAGTALTETKELEAGHVRGAGTVQISFTYAGHSGLVDIQGRLHPDDTWRNLPYVIIGDGALTATNDQVSNTTVTGTVDYQVLYPMPYMRVVMTRSAGSLVAYARYFSEPLSVQLAPGTVTLAAIPAGNNNIGDVDVASIAAGETIIGKVVGPSDVINIVPTLSVAGGYVANDYVGPSTTAFTIAGVARLVGGRATIQSVVLGDKALQSVAMELWLFSTAVTVPTDNAAWTITDAHMLNCVGVISISAYFASAANSVGVAAAIGLEVECDAADTALYGAPVTRGAPTYAAGDLQLKIGILQD